MMYSTAGMPHLEAIETSKNFLKSTNAYKIIEPSKARWKLWLNKHGPPENYMPKSNLQKSSPREKTSLANVEID